MSRLRPYTTTIFAEMSALASRTGSINLGQGFPDTDGPPSVLAAARQAIADGINQYPPGPGIPELRQAIAFARERDYGQVFDPDTEVLVTVGATEALAASAELAAFGISSGPCGAATLAALRGALGDPARRAALDLPDAPVVVLLSTEGRQA